MNDDNCYKCGDVIDIQGRGYLCYACSIQHDLEKLEGVSEYLADFLDVPEQEVGHG